MIRISLALALAGGRQRVVHAEDPSPAPAPAPGSEAAARLARADELTAQLVGLYEAGRFADGTVIAREALAIREKVLGEHDRRIAESLGLLAEFLRVQHALAEAQPLFERAIGIMEKTLGKDHLDLATTLTNLAFLFRDQGQRAKARPLYERVIAIREKALGKDHADVGAALYNLAVLLDEQGAPAEARPLFERSLAIDEQVFGKDSPELVPEMLHLARILQGQLAYADARTLFERALEIRKTSLGDDHVEVADSLHDLAMLLHAQGDYPGARALHERALSIQERVLGAEHPVVAQGLNDLAVLLVEMGAYGAARPLYARALSIGEGAFGKDDPRIAAVLNNFAALLQSEGAYAEAQPLYERALAIWEASGGKDLRNVGVALSNLAQNLKAQHSFGEARKRFERALTILGKTVGENHPDLTTCLTGIAELLRAEGAYAEARPLYERALAIDERALGRDHPRVSTDLNNLALVLMAQRAFGDARRLFERSLAIRSRAFGAEAPSVANVLNNLALLLKTQGAYAEARPFYERALAMTEAHARAQFSALSTNQRLGLLRSTRGRLDNWLHFAPNVGLSGYPEVLRFRGLVARAESAERALSRHANGEDRRTQEALAAAQRRAARLANAPPSALTAESRAAWQKAYAEASAEREKLSLALTERVAPMRAALERLDLGLKDVQARLGPDAALVDFLRVGDRYLAWIVRAAGEPSRVDVGAAEAIEKAASAFLEAIDDGQDALAAGAGLRALVWVPIENRLDAGVKRVVICPDASLAAVPFAALPGKSPGAFLLDEIPISYVMSPQDLVPWKGPRSVGVGALAVGGVDYGHAAAAPKDGMGRERPTALASIDRAPRGGAFQPIPGTRAEVEGLRDRLGRDATTLLIGADATESGLREAIRGRQFVHIATHGFAREDLLAGLYSRKIEEGFVSADTERQLAVGHDPMLLAGLAMAGANPREGGAGDDGILTALEASYLDLEGADLVILSACETAKGTAESGQGVQGLVSAFQMAGARQVVASLWKVDDEGTRRLMDGLYERMLRKDKDHPLSPAAALRESALALREFRDADGKARFAAPRYWAAFVAYGP